MLKLRKRLKGDPESLHGKMDELLCAVLRELGYEQGVRVFENTERWYA